MRPRPRLPPLRSFRVELPRPRAPFPRRHGRASPLHPSFRRRPGIRRQFVLNLDLGGRVRIRAAVNFGVDQREANLRHARGIAVARAGENHVFHARAAQRLGRLLPEHPGDGVGDIRLAAAVRADDGGNAFAMELQLGAIAERLESQNLQLLEFEQSDSFVGGPSNVVRGLGCAGWSALQMRGLGLTRLLTSRFLAGRIIGCRPPEPGTSPMLLTNSNGEYRDGSSNKTPHIVVPVRAPPLVAQYTAAIARKLLVRNRKAGDRESNFTVPPAGRRCNFDRSASSLRA
jgi:hypothetical protein